MKLIKAALRHPISILVLVAGLFFFGVSAIKSIKVDIFPQMNLPVIYIAHPFSGYTPDQMEAFFAKQYINALLLANGIKNIETRNIQGLTLIKITFYEGTNMAQAAAEITALSNRVQILFPPGSQAPFVLRFDASSLPVGELVLSSPTRSNTELQDLANVYVRSAFTAVHGLIAPLPFGGSPRTIEINVDPISMRAHNITPDQIVEAIRINNQTAPSGNVRIGKYNYLTPTNNTLKTVKDFENIPLFKGSVDNLYLKDVAEVKDGADLVVGYALINGKRSVYITVAKASDAATWDVVKGLKAILPRIKATLPEDVAVSYEFDQSVYVINAVKSLVKEGAIGALLTGIMVLLFLGDRRAALIVILTIPTSVISGVLFLKLFGQTINIMTLSGLALAIGILVDESTVTIENIHRHLDLGKQKARAVWDACAEIAFSKLLILLCILAVFAPAFTMTGIPGALFLPLALAIGCCMIVSYFLAQTFVPIMANWLIRVEPKKDNKGPGGFERFKGWFAGMLTRLIPRHKLVVVVYLAITIGASFFLLNSVGKDVLPKVNSSQFQLRLRAPDGTRIEETEKDVLTVLGELDNLVGKEHVAISSVYIGLHPSVFSLNPIYLFTSGPHEAVFQVGLKDYHADMDDFKDRLRTRINAALPDSKLSFEPIELTEKILSQGSPTPIEVRLAGRNKKTSVAYAYRLISELNKLGYIRDAQIGQPVNYPALDIDVDRIKAAQLGVDMNSISQALIPATSSSRYTEKNIWIDEVVGLSYNVQVQVPPAKITSLDDLNQVPVLRNTYRPMLSDIATVTPDTTYGEDDDLGTLPYVTVTANTSHKDLGAAAADIRRAIQNLGTLPRGLFVEPIGLTTVLTDTFDSLQKGLLVAVVVVFLMLSANFQSFKVSLVTLATIPAVVMGALLALKITGSTLNLQSYMGIIMSVGVSISNAVLMITNAEKLRLGNRDAAASAKEAATIRLRPIIMTSLAMFVGMLPTAIGEGEGGGQVSPLGRAVIGGLFASTFAVLIVLPLVFIWVQQKTTVQSPSLDPDDTTSAFFDGTQHSPTLI